MNYITLTPEVFFDESGKPSMEFLSQYCQLPTTNKFIYNGDIHGSGFDDLKFPNIVKADEIASHDIANQFPDLEEVVTTHYYFENSPDIGNIKSANYFYMFLWSIDKAEYIPFVRKNVKIIDNKTLIINRKELNVNISWRIGTITSSNYKQKGF